MWLIILIIIIIVVIIMLVRKNSGGNVSSDDVNRLFVYYEKIRNNYHNGSRCSAIFLASPVVEYDGTPVLSGFLSVFVLEDDNSGDASAQAIGMESKERDGKFEHHFIIKKRFSKSVKRQLLQTVGAKIQEFYPNDLLNYDDSIPMLTSMVDMKDFIEAIQAR